MVLLKQCSSWAWYLCLCSPVDQVKVTGANHMPLYIGDSAFPDCGILRRSVLHLSEDTQDDVCKPLNTVLRSSGTWQRLTLSLPAGESLGLSVSPVSLQSVLYVVSSMQPFSRPECIDYETFWPQDPPAWSSAPKAILGWVSVNA